MKEFMVLNANFSLVEQEDHTLVPLGEMIIVATEPSYAIDAAGQVIRSRDKTDSTRLGFTINALERFEQDVQIMLDEMRSMEARLPGKMKENGP